MSAPPQPVDPLVSTGVIVLQKGLILLGMLGVSVPAVLQQPAVEVQVVSFLVGLGALAWSAYSHLKTRTQAATARLR